MENWKTYKLGEVSKDIAYGYTASATTKPSGAKFLRITDIQGGNVNWKEVPYCEIDDQKKRQYQLGIGDIVIARTGNSTGENTIIKEEVDAVFASYLIRYQIDEAKVNPLYVAYCLRSPDWWNFVQSIKGGSAQAGANAKQIARFEFDCPESIEEQKAITKILSSLDDKIELNRRMNETLEAIARALFKAWFMDFEPVRANMENRLSESASPEIAKLFPSELENGIPKGWEVKELNKIFEVNPLRSLQKGKSAKYLDMANGPTSGHRVSGWINREFSSGTKFKKGDTLLARITPCLENGKTAFVDFLDDEEIGWGSTEFIVLRPQNGLPNYFAYLLCRNDDFRNFAIQSMTGTSGRQRVQVDSLGKYLLLVPPKDSLISEKFGLALNPIVERIKQNSEEITCLAQIRDSLLPRLISGKIPVGKIKSEAKGENE